MSDLKVVFYNGNSLLVHQTVLDQMGLRQGQNITEGQMWRCIELNAAAIVADMAVRRAAGEDVPDTTKLEATLSRLAKRR